MRSIYDTVKSGSGGTVTTSDGSPLKTRSDDEIAKQNKKGRGAAMESVNKKFNITDALYQSVMEVMKGGKEGSVPRNEKEKDLAKFHGDPNRITHGDVLKARGVTKEEVEDFDEALVGNQHRIDANKNNKIDAHDFRLLRAKKKPSEDAVKEGIMDKVLPILTGGSDKDLLKKLQKDMGVKQTGQKPTPPAPVKPKGMAEGSLNELSVNTLSSYGKKAGRSIDRKLDQAADHTKKATDLYSKGTASAVDKAYDHEDKANNLHKQVNKRAAGMDRAAAKLGNKFKKGMAEGSMGENKDTPGNSYEHQCAVHVKSESFGEGRTITTQHANPDADGNIAWYDVMFEHGIEKQVPTSALEILVSEMHMHSKKKKKMM